MGRSIRAMAWIAVAAASVGCAGPMNGAGAVAPAQATRGRGDDAAPQVESTRLTGVLVGGTFLLAASYAPTAYVGLRSPRAADRILAVPGAGPWLDLANRGTCVPEATPIKLPVDSCLPETLARAALVTAGVVEDLGLALTILRAPHVFAHRARLRARRALATERPSRGDRSDREWRGGRRHVLTARSDRTSRRRLTRGSVCAVTPSPSPPRAATPRPARGRRRESRARARSACPSDPRAASPCAAAQARRDMPLRIPS